LTEAISLYRDDFLAGFTLRDSPGFDEWQFFQTECLRQEFATALERLAQAYTGQGAYERAIVYARRWLSLEPLHESAHRYLMRLYAESGQRVAALRQYEDARVQGQLGLALSREIGYSTGTGFSCDLLGYLALAAEEYSQALELFRESIAIYREIGQREDMGWALVGSGYAARGLGDLHAAQQHFYETLKLAVEIGTLTQLLWALPGIALLLTDQGDADRAIELYALASRYPNVAHSNWFEDVAGRHIAAIATALPRDEISAARTLGENRDLDATSF